MKQIENQLYNYFEDENENLFNENSIFSQNFTNENRRFSELVNTYFPNDRFSQG